MLVWEDECWFSRFAQPTMNAWTADGKSLALLQHDKSKDDPEPKAVACFGALDHESGKVHLRFSNGQPNSTYTLEFWNTCSRWLRKEENEYWWPSGTRRVGTRASKSVPG